MLGGRTRKWSVSGKSENYILTITSIIQRYKLFYLEIGGEVLVGSGSGFFLRSAPAPGASSIQKRLAPDGFGSGPGSETLVEE